jgi:uncharacterized protein (DUF2345 family)
LFNGQPGTGGNIKNNIKSIYTRTGSTITFDEGDSSILVKDPSGNKWFMDGKGNINVTAVKNIAMNAGDDFIVSAGKNVKIEAGENMDCNAGKDISQTAGNDLTQTASGDITESSDNRKEMVDKDFLRQAETSNVVASGVTIFSNKENLTLQSGKTVEVNSAEKSKMF